jgi:hypothetical protein
MKAPAHRINMQKSITFLLIGISIKNTVLFALTSKQLK